VRARKIQGLPLERRSGWSLAYKKESSGLHWGAAIPRFPADAIGVPGLTKERGKKKKKETKRSKHVPLRR
jgi:hypothetical protein